MLAGLVFAEIDPVPQEECQMGQSRTTYCAQFNVRCSTTFGVPCVKCIGIPNGVIMECQEMQNHTCIHLIPSNIMGLAPAEVLLAGTVLGRLHVEPRSVFIDRLRPGESIESRITVTLDHESPEAVTLSCVEPWIILELEPERSGAKQRTCILTIKAPPPGVQQATVRFVCKSLKTEVELPVSVNVR